MKKISIFAAVLALLTLSLNAQLNTAKKAVVKPKTTTEKKVDMPQDGFKMYLQPEGFRAPKRATVEHTSTLTFTAKCNGAGTADDGVAWTVTSDATESNFDNTRGIHYGTNSARVTYIELSTSGIPTNATITNIAVNASRGGSTAAYLNATVNGNQFGSQQTLTTSAATYNLSGQAASGNIVVRISKTRSTGALYCKSIAVTYETEEGGGAETTDLTVCDGQYNAQVLPVLGYFHDVSQHNQMIYPASMLSAMAGKTIKSMTFYPTTGSFDSNNDGTNETYTGINFYGGSVTFKLMNMSSGNTGFTQSNPTLITGTMTAVKTIVPVQNTSATTWVINFDQDFTYTGGDLLIDVTNVADTYGVTFFTVDATSNYAGMYSYVYNGSTSSAGLTYLPKVTFTYEGAPNPVHDLGIALSAQPTAVGVGNAITLTATVTNTGNQTEEGYTVTFTAGGTTIATQTASEPLAAGATATFTTTYTPTEAQAGQTVNFGASVACTDDADATNNDATASAQVITLPPPENVAATGDAGSGTMTWDAPIIPATVIQVTESFENGTNGWSFIDADGDGHNWTWHQNTGTNNLTTQTGDCIVYSESYDNDNQTALEPNNWLISPEAILDGTLSLYASGQDNQGYDKEVFGVYVCVGSYNGISDFQQVENDVTTSYGMAPYTFDLSQYQGQVGHFAIVHHNVSDQFILDIDDITYKASAPGEQPTSYNIYLDGQLVGNVDANTFSYTFDNLSDGTYQCAVSAVYSYGESVAVPATFTIDTSNPTIEITPATQTINDAAPGALTVTGTDITGNINVSAASNDWTVNPSSLGNTGGNVSVTYTGRDLSATTTVTASATGATDATATVDYVADLYIVGDYGSGWNFSDNSNHMTYNNGTYTATITVNANDYILFARLLGNDNPWNTRDVFGPDSNGNWGMQGDSYGGNIDLNDDDPIYFPEGGTYRITIDANNGTFTITKLSGEQTAQPVITYSLSSDGQHVTITATGDGTVTLNVPGHDPVSGEGEVSITVPCGYASNTITVTATAQEVGKDESDPASQQITIPAGSDWVEMTGTYNNPNDLLSFQVKVGNDTIDIMLIDQFAESTLKNDHPDHYTYTLRQTVNGETTTSTPVSIPVYKTNSSMQGLYTLNQVTGDTDMKLKPNVFNTKMNYDVNPDRNVLYYSLYRGDVNDTYPEITAQSRISQLQKFEEMVGEGENAQPQFFLFESHPEGIAPRYDRLGTAIAERLDTNWVEGTLDNMLPYVPVIWTYGLYTARGDGKNNSYGSDIKREYMGKTTAEINGDISQGANGTWKDINGTEYRAFHPTITVTGYLPQSNNNYEVDYNDGDIAHYEPYLCRAWCTNEGIHDYGRDADGHLEDLGELQTPFLVGDATFGDDLTAIIGGEWTHGSVRDPWSFGLPTSVAQDEVNFVIRFYYKKVVTEAQPQQNGSKIRLGNEPEGFFMAQFEGNADDMVVALNEFMNGIVPVDVTYVNPQGMQSSRPFDGVNIVVTRYSDGSTRTSKIIR